MKLTTVETISRQPTNSEQSSATRKRHPLTSGAQERCFKSCSDDEFMENELRHIIHDIEADLFEEYCSELPNLHNNFAVGDKS